MLYQIKQFLEGFKIFMQNTYLFSIYIKEVQYED